MDTLPRELQLAVVKRMDIDTRRACGIKPCRIRIPELDISPVKIGVHAGPYYLFYLDTSSGGGLFGIAESRPYRLLHHTFWTADGVETTHNTT